MRLIGGHVGLRVAEFQDATLRLGVVSASSGVVAGVDRYCTKEWSVVTW